MNHSVGALELILVAAVLVIAAVAIRLLVRHRRKELPPAPAEKAELPPPAQPTLEPPPEPTREPRIERPAIPVAEPVQKPHTVVPSIVRAERRAALRGGLAKTRSGFVGRLGRIFATKAKIDEDLLGQIEEVLFTADIGVKTSNRLIEQLRTRLSRAEAKDPEAIWDLLKQESSALLHIEVPPISLDRAKPFVILMIGVNGVGKTTTIGKLAAQYRQQGKRVLLAAGDTFRAAATEQLEVWAQRTGCPLVRGKEGADPSSVIFEAVRAGAAEGFDVVLADTAGRLHTKSDLMEELQKVRRVCAKASEGAPHETFLVLDATNGQNAIQQAMLFKQAMDVTGIILTKLDGTAKGGVILGICDELKLPVRYIGIGERVEDLRAFDADEFVEALFEKSTADEAA